MEQPADPIRCGIGEGAKCCRYLFVGDDGFECIRAHPNAEVVDQKVEAGEYISVWKPTAPYPSCQAERLAVVSHPAGGA